MDSVLNWGLLSTARINRALIRPLQSSKRTRLLAVASRDADNARAYSRKWDIPRAYGSYEELLADSEIDVVYNSLPNHLHAEWSIRALRAGKHVLCEKPIALTLAEVDAMQQAASETGRVLMEGFMYRHHAQTLKVKQMVESGALGKLQLVRGSFTFNLTRPDDIRMRKESGGGSIWDVGCYPISYARLLAGTEPLEVFGWQQVNPEGVDESFFGELRFPDGVHAQFDSGFRSPARSMIEIVGSEAVLQVPQPFKPESKSEILLIKEGRLQRIKVKGTELYLGEVEDICNAITSGQAPRVTLADSRGNLATILALLESARSGKPVRVDSC